MSRLLHSLDDLPPDLRGGGLTIGNFDAVHVGHAALVAALLEATARVHKPALVFTFDPPPGVVLRPELPRIKPLTTLKRRLDLVTKLGIDALIAYPTTAKFLELTAEQFFQQILVDRLAATTLVEGENFRFGRGRAGDVELLKKLSSQFGIEFQAVRLLDSDGLSVSSTRIRELIAAGRVGQANELLVEPYRIEGDVVVGAQRGRTIGFPTCNLSSIPVLLPAAGVYAGRVCDIQSNPLPAAIHIGPNPTFGDSEPKVEVHIIDWSGDLYGRRMQVEVLEHVRAVQKFASVELLQQQLSEDVRACARIANSRS